MRTATCHPDRKYYAKSLCRTCYNREHSKVRPDRSDYLANYREANPDKCEAYYDARRADPAKRERDAATGKWHAVKDKYGLTQADFEALLVKQGDACAICKRLFSSLTDKKYGPERIDHCHTSGKVRGILCNRCNSGLGFLGDDVAGLKVALQYLEEAETQ